MSDWRLNPVGERELAEDRRRARRRRANAAFLVLASMGLCPFACMGSCFGLSGGGAIYLVGAAASLGAFVFALVRYARDAERSRARRTALRQEFAGVPGWLVHLTVYQGEAVSGRDVGVVWFGDGRMYFTGLRTSFGILPADIQGRIGEGRNVLDGGIDLLLPLREASAVGAVAIGLRFAEPEGNTTPLTSGEWAFQKALQGWFAAKGEGRGQGPPLAPGPDRPSERSLLVRALLSSAAWPALFALLATGVWLSPSDGWPALLLIGLVGALAIATSRLSSPRRHWRALSDRRRLEAYNRDGDEGDGTRGREAPPGPDLGPGGGNPENGG